MVQLQPKPTEKSEPLRYRAESGYKHPWPRGKSWVHISFVRDLVPPINNGCQPSLQRLGVCPKILPYLRVDPFKVADQQQPEVPTGREARPSHHRLV